MKIKFSLAIGWTMFILSASAQEVVTNQRVFDTIPFLPEFWPKRAAQLEAEPISTGHIIFLGNSITQIGDWKKLLNDTTVINRGIAGDITFGVLKRLDDVIRRKPSKIFILIGINDIGKDIPDAVIANNVKKIISRLKSESPSTNIYLQSILPVNPDVKGFPQHYDKQQHVLSTNLLLKKAAEDLAVPYVDLHSLFVDSEGKLKSSLTMDGLHLTPNGDGYKMWVDYLHKKGYL